MKLTRESFTGPWAGLPVAWSSGRFDEERYRKDVRSCCLAGIPGVYTGGTTGEFYALEIDEFEEVTRATIEEGHAGRTPVMIGCSATSTRGAARRARIAAEIGADAIQVALPFWMKVGDAEVISFFRDVSDAAGGIPLSIYETKRSKKTLSVKQHREVKIALPNYLMVKANLGTVGADEEGCRELSKFLNVFAGEPLWAELGPRGLAGACSAMVYWNPRLILALWEQVKAKNWEVVSATHEKIDALHRFLGSEFGSRGFTDSAYDRLVGNTIGILRSGLECARPYPSPTGADGKILRAWYEKYFPEILNRE